MILRPGVAFVPLTGAGRTISAFVADQIGAAAQQRQRAAGNRTERW
jgi:hypothetical protein